MANVKEGLEWYRKWSMSLFMPIVTALIGYHTLYVKTQILKEVEEKYVQKQVFEPYKQKVEHDSAILDQATTSFLSKTTFDSEFPALARRVGNLEVAIATLQADSKNSLDILKDLRNDVKNLDRKRNIP